CCLFAKARSPWEGNMFRPWVAVPPRPADKTDMRSGPSLGDEDTNRGVTGRTRQRSIVGYTPLQRSPQHLKAFHRPSPTSEWAHPLVVVFLPDRTAQPEGDLRGRP